MRDCEYYSVNHSDLREEKLLEDLEQASKDVNHLLKVAEEVAPFQRAQEGLRQVPEGYPGVLDAPLEIGSENGPRTREKYKQKYPWIWSPHSEDGSALSDRQRKRIEEAEVGVEA